MDAALEACSIGFYQVQVRPHQHPWGGHILYVFAGKTATGRMLFDEECRAALALQVVRHSTHGERFGNKTRHMQTKPPHELDALIDSDAFIQKMLTETATAEREENFVACLIWEKGRKNDAKLFSVGHEYLLLYAKSLHTVKILPE